MATPPPTGTVHLPPFAIQSAVMFGEEPTDQRRRREGERRQAEQDQQEAGSRALDLVERQPDLHYALEAAALEDRDRQDTDGRVNVTRTLTRG